MFAKLYDGGRATERHAIDADATLRTEDQVPVDVLVANLSMTGCLFVCAAPLDLGSDVTIGISGLGRRQVRIVRAMDQRYGCEFLEPLSEADIAAVVDAPGSTIVPYPAWPLVTVADGQEPPSAARLPGVVRLAILGGGTLGVWWAAIALLRGLH